MMSERIKQLMTQASTIRYSGFGETEILDPEKFAELIIQECCDVLYDNELGGYRVEYVLKEHFGVE